MTFTVASPKKVQRWQVSTGKDMVHHTPSGTRRLKPRRDSPAHLWERPQPGTLATPDGGEDAEGVNSRRGWDRSMCSLFGRRLGRSLQTEHALTTRSAATLGVELKELKTQVHAKPCTHRFVAALTAVAKAWWKPSDCVHRGASMFPGKQ